MTGDIGEFIPGVVDDPVHDPAIVKDPSNQTYYVFSTGILRNPQDPGGIFVRRSTGSLAGPWESLGEIAVPEWTREYGHSHLWAPQVVRQGQTYYLYYAASSFGQNTSAIGVASTRTPGDLDSWEDHGPVVTSQADVDEYNAIDPHVFKADGRWWIAFGSHWTGMRLQELASMPKPPGRSTGWPIGKCRPTPSRLPRSSSGEVLLPADVVGQVLRRHGQHAPGRRRPV